MAVVALLVVIFIKPEDVSALAVDEAGISLEGEDRHDLGATLRDTAEMSTRTGAKRYSQANLGDVVAAAMESSVEASGPRLEGVKAALQPKSKVDVAKAAVAKANALRVKARKALRAKGQPIPAAPQSGVLQNKVRSKLPEASDLKLAKAKVKIKKARKLRKRARRALRGHHVPAELQKGKLTQQVVKQLPKAMTKGMRKKARKTL